MRRAMPYPMSPAPMSRSIVAATTPAATLDGGSVVDASAGSSPWVAAPSMSSPFAPWDATRPRYPTSRRPRSAGGGRRVVGLELGHLGEHATGVDRLVPGNSRQLAIGPVDLEGQALGFGPETERAQIDAPSRLDAGATG